MATTLFLRSTVVSGNVLALDTAGGTGATDSATVNTISAGNHIVFATGANITWVYQVSAVTISGSISFNLWGKEDAMTTNARLACRVARYDSSRTFVSDVVDNANANHPDDIELGTSAAAMTWSATPTSTTFADGDHIAVIVHADNIGTMAVGTATLDYDVSGSGVDGDSFVTFTETIVPFGTAATQVPYTWRYPALVAQ